jgi:uncharacterized protein YegP (UPF0339 family)
LVFAGLLTAALGLGGAGAQEKGKGQKERLTFEVYKDAKDEFRWRLKAGNGQVIATAGQGYKSKADCEHGIQIIKDGAAEAKVEEASGK